MISLETAQALKNAGLTWRPQLHDFFAIPERGFDDRIFVLSDMTVAIEVLNGYPAITFNGAVEWSLDFIYQFDVVWLPREEQLQRLLMDHLAQRQPAAEPHFTLEIQPANCRLSLPAANGRPAPSPFEAAKAAETYAQALLFLLQP